MSTPLIRLEGVSKTFDDTMVLDDLELSIRENEFMTLLGPSGCGKTTTLRIIGGFEKPDKGRVLFDGKDITNLSTKQAAAQHGISEIRPVSPYEHRGKYCIRIKDQREKSKAYIKDKINYALKLVNLDGYENRMR